MAKVTLVPLGSLENQTTFLQTLNENFEALAAALEVTLSRDGTTPNEMSANHDLNDKRIINLGSPISGSDAARLIDILEAGEFEDYPVPSLASNEDKLLSNDGTVLYWATPSDIPGFGDLRAENNLDDLDDPVTARTNLGLGTSATYNISTSGSNVPVLNGTNTWSGAQTFSGASNFSGAVTLSGTANHQITATPTALTDASIGFLGVPTATIDADYTFVIGDAGKRKMHTSATGHTYTIPPASSVNFPNGTVLVIRNIGAGAVTVARGSGVTLRLLGVATDANASVAQWGEAALIKDTANEWSIRGVNVT